MDYQSVGKSIIMVGVVIILVGLVIYVTGQKFSFFGNLPGDIKVEKENFRFYFPLTSMILVSVVISLVMKLWQYLK